MIKQLKLGKSSFTLLETIVSLFILSIVIVGFSNFKNYDNLDEEFMSLNRIENSFTTNSYNENFNSKQISLTIIENETQKKSLSVNQITYEDEKIRVIKYEL